MSNNLENIVDVKSLWINISSEMVSDHKPAPGLFITRDEALGDKSSQVL